MKETSTKDYLVVLVILLSKQDGINEQGGNIFQIY